MIMTSHESIVSLWENEASVTYIKPNRLKTSWKAFTLERIASTHPLISIHLVLRSKSIYARYRRSNTGDLLFGIRITAAIDEAHTKFWPYNKSNRAVKVDITQHISSSLLWHAYNSNSNRTMFK
eukprot:105726_1